MGDPVQLRGSDARALLAFAGDVADCRDAAQLDAQIARLPCVVGADAVIVTDCREWAQDVVLEVGDPGVYRSDMWDAVARGWREHPLLRRDFARAADGARRTSDFVRPREWRRRGLFNDFYRPLGMTRELAAQLSWGPVGSSCCVALHRAGSDFSERDRAALGLVGPHLRSARARIAAEALAARRLALLEHGAEGTGPGALLVDPSKRLVAAGARGRELLERWFGAGRHALPGDLADWYTTARARVAAPALEIASGEQRLRVRLVLGGDEDLVLLSEHDTTLSPSRLAQRLPITRREADV